MTAPSTESTTPALPSCAETGPCSGRRAVLGGAAALGALGLLAACGGGSSDTAQPAPAPAGGSGTGGESTSTPTTGGQNSGSSGGADLGPASAVPVGGGKTFEDQGVIVTQPTAGDFRAFSSACTHTGCVIYETEGGTMNCGCHGSKFSDKDGSVVKGPANAPLAKKSVTVSGGNLKLG